MRQSATKWRLRAYHYEAVELRYGGKTYKEISLLLIDKYKRDFKEQTVRRWFSADGMLESKYLDYAHKENERRRQLVLEELKKIIPQIPRKFDALLNRKDEKGNEKLDVVTLNTLKALCDFLNFRVTPEDPTNNPLNDFFDRIDKEIQQDQKA